MATSPFHLKGSGDEAHTFLFSLKKNGDGMATSPFEGKVQGMVASPFYREGSGWPPVPLR